MRELAILTMWIVASGLTAAEPATRPAAPAVKYVVVFDFACPESAELGVQLADSVRTRLARHEQYKVVDRLTTNEVAPAGSVTPATADEKVAALLKDKFAAQVAIYGTVQKAGDTVRAEIRCLDITPLVDKQPVPPDAKPAGWTKVFSDASERARGQIATAVVEALRNAAEWKPPEYGDEAEPANFGKPLNANGDFESPLAGGKPPGWQAPDNVSMFLVADPRPGKTGKVLRIFTDLDREAWVKYQQDLRLGKADPARPPKIGTVDDKYATVAGMEGVHFRSDWIEVGSDAGILPASAVPTYVGISPAETKDGRPAGAGKMSLRDETPASLPQPAKGGQRYWLTADMKGKTADIFFPKIFVKGFADFSARPDALSEVSLNELKLTAADFAKLPAAEQAARIAADAKAHPDRYRREVYRWFLACRDEDDTWRHFAAPFPPRGGLPANVQWLRIEVYAYWPPGEFFFDNVHLYADPRQSAPLPEEPARTAGYRPTTAPK